MSDEDKSCRSRKKLDRNVFLFTRNENKWTRQIVCLNLCSI